MRTPRATFLSIFIALGFVLIGTYGCGDDDFFGPNDEQATLDESDRCAQTCVGDQRCFESISGEPSCQRPECENDTAVCAPGYTCNTSSDRCELRECPGGCEAGTHCVFGQCVTDYNDQNVCAPLFSCRESCPTSELQDCLGTCQRDASPTCDTCLNTLNRCENRDSCNGNATTCCVDEYCSCFPNNPQCLNPNAPDCETCAVECRGADDPNRCLSICADQVPECSQCLVPFDQCRDDLEAGEDVEEECGDAFCDCIDCSVTADVDFSPFF